MIFKGEQSVEFGNYGQLLSSCKSGSASDVLSQMRQSGFDSRVIKERIGLRLYGAPIPGTGVSSPWQKVIDNDNLEVIRLFLMLGGDPNIECCNRSKKTTPYLYASEKPEVLAIFDSASPWWNTDFSASQLHDLQSTLEECIRRGAFSDILWHGVRGVCLERPDILLSEEFINAPRQLRELVCRLCVPDEKKADFRQWLLERQATKAAIEYLVEEQDDAEEVLKTFFLSIGLLTEKSLEGLAKEILIGKNPLTLLKKQFIAAKAGVAWVNTNYVQMLMETFCKDILFNYDTIG